MHRILSKKLLLEIVANFFVGFIIFTFVLLTGRTFQMTDMIVNKGLSVITLFKLFGMMLPFFLVFTIPMSFVLAVILTFSRMSYDYEIIALKSSGVSLTQLVKPVMIFSVFACVLTSYLTIFVAPTSNFNLKKFVVNVLQSQVNVAIEEKVFNNVAGRIIYVDHIPVRSNHLYGILIYDDTNEDLTATIVAREGYIYSDETTQYFSIRLNDGSILISGKYTDTDKMTMFQKYNVNLPLFGDEDESTVGKKNWEMTLDELLSSVGGLKQNLTGMRAEYKKHPSPQNKMLVEDIEHNIRKKQVEISKMFAVPFACIVFMIIGIPISIQTNPKGRSASLVLVILVIFVYYVFLALGEFLGKNGLVPPLLSMWLGNIILGSAGVYLFIMARRESPVFLITMYNSASDAMTKLISRMSR